MICIKMLYQAGDEMKTHRERNPGKSRMIKTVDLKIRSYVALK